MKFSKAETHSRVHKIPTVRFEGKHRLTSFAGLVSFMKLFDVLRVKDNLRLCFDHLSSSSIVGHAVVFLLLVVHLLLGFRRMRDLDYYRSDPMVERTLGLRRLPDVSTISRTLRSADPRCVDNVRSWLRGLTIQRLLLQRLARVTLDFDGSVQSTKSHAEGTAVGFNKVKKGARSYYPLFCTVAQTGQFLDMYHRPGNVHDSNGAAEFMARCFEQVRAAQPGVIIEARMDSAFFNETALNQLRSSPVQFSCSVPFERFAELKKLIETQTIWNRLNHKVSYFESGWRPKSWKTDYRFIFVRQRRPKQHKGPLQLDLFVPQDFEYEYKVIVTNKTSSPNSVLMFHNGRGSQEGVFAEAKQHAGLDMVPTRTLVGNQLFTLAGLTAHNLTRELQMRSRPHERPTLPKRPPLWKFRTLGTVCQGLIRVAGRLVRPQGELTLIVNDDGETRRRMSPYLEAAG